jgi:hypothetical protein
MAENGEAKFQDKLNFSIDLKTAAQRRNLENEDLMR